MCYKLCLAIAIGRLHAFASSCLITDIALTLFCVVYVAVVPSLMFAMRNSKTIADRTAHACKSQRTRVHQNLFSSMGAASSKSSPRATTGSKKMFKCFASSQRTFLSLVEELPSFGGFLNDDGRVNKGCRRRCCEKIVFEAPTIAPEHHGKPKEYLKFQHEAVPATTTHLGATSNALRIHEHPGSTTVKRVSFNSVQKAQMAAS